MSPTKGRKKKHLPTKFFCSKTVQHFKCNYAYPVATLRGMVKENCALQRNKIQTKPADSGIIECSDCYSNFWFSIDHVKSYSFGRSRPHAIRPIDLIRPIALDSIDFFLASEFFFPRFEVLYPLVEYQVRTITVLPVDACDCALLFSTLFFKRHLVRSLRLNVSTAIVVNMLKSHADLFYANECPPYTEFLFAAHPESKSKIVLAQSYGHGIPIDDCFNCSLCKRVLVDLGCVTAIITRATVTTRFRIRNNARRL
ncbi:hypothetical protein QTP88_017120 [Uroleucon formosanum]